MYKLYKNAIEKGYPIFDKNIREYLGCKGINKNIYNTLKDVDERKNFFYYNNGITVICDNMQSIKTVPGMSKLHAVFNIENPQIVNGCQTVNSIYEALQNVNPDKLEEEYKDVFVMVKILQINRKHSNETTLYQNIVRYNNSQNSLDEKTFVANTNVFLRLQKEFESKGFLLLIKQSDKNQYNIKYKIITDLISKNSDRINKFGLQSIKKASDLFIPLEKLLQVICAFTQGGQTAYVKKSNMLKFGSVEYNLATSFIKNNDVTIDTLIDLYMLYKRAEQDKKSSTEKRTPISYYLIDGFAKYECYDRQPSKIVEELSTADKINKVLKIYSFTTKRYGKDYSSTYGVDYNKMIKQDIDYVMFDKARDTVIDILADL